MNTTRGISNRGFDRLPRWGFLAMVADGFPGCSRRELKAIGRAGNATIRGGSSVRRVSLGLLQVKCPSVGRTLKPPSACSARLRLGCWAGRFDAESGTWHRRDKTASSGVAQA